MLCLRAELMEADAVKDGTIDLAAYGSLTDQLGRCFNRLGLKRVAYHVSNPILEPPDSRHHPHLAMRPTARS